MSLRLESQADTSAKPLPAKNSNKLLTLSGSLVGLFDWQNVTSESILKFFILTFFNKTFYKEPLDTTRASLSDVLLTTFPLSFIYQFSLSLAYSRHLQ
jgi:hypothetical protein